MLCSVDLDMLLREHGIFNGLSCMHTKLQEKISNQAEYKTNESKMSCAVEVKVSLNTHNLSESYSLPGHVSGFQAKILALWETFRTLPVKHNYFDGESTRHSEFGAEPKLMNRCRNVLNTLDGSLKGHGNVGTSGPAD